MRFIIGLITFYFHYTCSAYEPTRTDLAAHWRGGSSGGSSSLLLSNTRRHQGGGPLLSTDSVGSTLPHPRPKLGVENHEDHYPGRNLSSYSKGRRGCGLYVWDALSALCYRWCHHLMKDCVYEGLGGHKFVRIEPGSILQLLYPCSRHSTDRCLICGGTFRDHLQLWWAKHLYTPYDRWLDRVLRTAIHDPDNVREKDSQERPGVRRPSIPAHLTFHGAYVTEKERSVEKDATSKPQRKRQNSRLAAANQHSPSKAERLERDVSITNQSNVTYWVPAPWHTNSSQPLLSRLMLSLAESIALNSIDELIKLQAREGSPPM